MGRLPFNAISPIFSKSFLERVVFNDHIVVLQELSEYFSKFSLPSKHQPLCTWFEFFYNILYSHYRSEYIYKNTIATDLFLERHTLQNAVLINELQCGNSKADVAIFNDRATVYEVKSEYDSLDRLPSQLADYQKVFDHIVVVTIEKKIKSVIDLVAGHVGIMLLDSKGQLQLVREPLSNKAHVDSGIIFDCMWKSEYCTLVEQEFGIRLNIPNGYLYREARKLFCQIKPDRAHDLMVKQVSLRGKKKPFDDERIQEISQSLKYVCLSFSKSRSLFNRIYERLLEPLRGGS